jgi:quercetin dioxygenase-like cupin family protein
MRTKISPEPTAAYAPPHRVDFATVGFAGPYKVFTRDQCHLIARRYRNGAQAEPLVWPKGLAASDRFFFDLAASARIVDLLRPILGKDIVLWGASVVERQPGECHPWHTDIESAAAKGRFASVWIKLESTSKDSTLKFVTGSHRFGKPVQAPMVEQGVEYGEITDEFVLSWAREIDHSASLQQQALDDGEAIIFDGRLWHASTNNLTEGIRVALLLQYAAADCPVFIPDYSAKPIWPFQFKQEPRPPVIQISGKASPGHNYVVPPPVAALEGATPLVRQIAPVRLPLDEDPVKGWKPYYLFRMATECLPAIESHVAVLSPAGGGPFSGQSHTPHFHDEEELLIVLDGKAELIADPDLRGKAEPVSALHRGSVVYHPAHCLHTLRNTADKPVTYLMLKWRRGPANTANHLPLTVLDCAGLPEPSPTDKFCGQLLLEGPTGYLKTLHIHLATLHDGAGYEPHVDEYDVAILVLDGKIEMLEQVCEAQDLIYLPAGKPHGLRNVGGGVARYLVFEFHADIHDPARRQCDLFADASERKSAERNDVESQEFKAFWVGPPLSLYEEACLKSFLSRGHRVVLFSYDRDLRVPEGVELADAGDILSGDVIAQFRHASGEKTPTTQSDLFRYEMLRRFGGWYIDLDVLLVSPNPPSAEYYFGYEDERYINNAILRFPKGAPVLGEAVDRAKGLIDDPEWGQTGPKLITNLLAKHGLTERARPYWNAYPIKPQEVRLLFSPAHREQLQERVAKADFVHLWGEIWRWVRIPKAYGPPEGSFLDSVFRRFDIRVPATARLSADAVQSWFEDFDTLEKARKVHGNPAQMMAELQNAAAERDNLLQSTSWRVTAPLRRVVSGFRALRGD